MAVQAYSLLQGNDLHLFEGPKSPSPRVLSSFCDRIIDGNIE